MQLFLLKNIYCGFILIYIIENNVWLSKGNYLIYLFKKEGYHRARYWVLFYFINDIPLVLSHCSLHLYADDAVIYT